MALAPTVIMILIATTIMFSSEYSGAQSPILGNSTTTVENNTRVSPLAAFQENESVIFDGTFREREGQAVPGQYIIVLKENEASNTTAGLENILRNLTTQVESLGADVLHVYKSAIKGFAIKAPNNQTFGEIRGILEANPQIESIVQDEYAVIRQAQVLPTGIDRVDSDKSAIIANDHEGLRVDADIAILDTGINPHTDLTIYRDVNIVDPGLPATDDVPAEHGTAVAGIAAAKDNLEGVVGTGPGAGIWNIKVCDRLGCSISDYIAGIDYVTLHSDEIDVANLSIGCRVDKCLPSLGALDMALNNSVQRGVVYVAAAGNDAQDARNDWPSRNPNVISVSAIYDTDGKCGGFGGRTHIGQDDAFWVKSNFGPAVDMAAPGVMIQVFKPYGYLGTSFAAPHVTGIAAMYIANHPEASPADVFKALAEAGIKPPMAACFGDGQGYFTGDPDNIPEPLLNAKRIDQFIISAQGQIRRDGYNLLAQGHYTCGPSAIATTRDAGIIFNGFLEGQLTNTRYPDQLVDLGKITVDATRDMRNVNTIIVVYSEDQTIRLRLVFQGTIDCSQPISQPVINAIDGTICRVSPTSAICGPISSAWLGLR